MKAVIAGELRGEPSRQLLELIGWGYVYRDGEGYGATDEGRKVWDTWQNMKGV